MTSSLDGARIWVAGHTGMVGSALLRRLSTEPVAELITATSGELDLRRQADTEAFVARTAPDVLVLAAARVGGIHANRTMQAEFLYDNLMITANAVEAAHRGGVQRILLFGSSCVYPRGAPQPMAEDALLTGPPEETNEGYAIAKVAGLELAKMYRRQHGADVIALVPTNLYGPNDNFSLETSHVLPALMRKVHDAARRGAREVEIWGTGTPRREFMHVDDLADAVVFALQRLDGGAGSPPGHLNVGVGEDVSIRELAELIADVIGWDGSFRYNTDMPDGMPRKLLDVSRITAAGWRAQIGLRDGVTSTYEWFRQHLPT